MAEKITPEQIEQYGVVAAPDVLTGTAQENKGVFDRLVREIVAPAVNDVIDLAAQLESENAEWEIKEAERQKNEGERIAAESARAAAEQGRVDAENARAAAEQGRAAAESARAAAEQGRANAESARVTAEQGRVTAESVRKAQSDALGVWEEYADSRSYEPLNKVVRNGASYVNIKPCRGIQPPDKDYWLLIASAGRDGTGAGDMVKEIYDPNGRADDIWAVRQIRDGGTGATTAEGALNALGALPTAGGLMRGPIQFGNDRRVSVGGPGTDFDFVAGKVAIRLIPENAVGNDISKCVVIRDTGNGALYPIATATPPQVYDMPLNAGIEAVTAGDRSVYYKDQFGNVTLHLCIKKTDGSAFAHEEQIAVMPAGFRPGVSVFATLINMEDSTPYGLVVRPDGNVATVGYQNNPLKLWGEIVFSAGA